MSLPYISSDGKRAIISILENSAIGETGFVQNTAKIIYEFMGCDQTGLFTKQVCAGILCGVSEDLVHNNNWDGGGKKLNAHGTVSFSGLFLSFNAQIWQKPSNEVIFTIKVQSRRLMYPDCAIRLVSQEDHAMPDLEVFEDFKCLVNKWIGRVTDHVIQMVVCPLCTKSLCNGENMYCTDCLRAYNGPSSVQCKCKVPFGTINKKTKLHVGCKRKFQDVE